MDKDIDIIQFKQNKPSIIDLYIDEEIVMDNILDRIKSNTIFDSLEVVSDKDGLVKIKLKYKKNIFEIYLKVYNNNYEDLDKISRVLVDDELIEKAKKQKKYIKSYINPFEEYVKAYYAQIKLLSLISEEPIIIVDCSQWCIYSKSYIKQFMENNIDIIDSNLFKIKSDNDGTLYSEGLERFGIKNIEMNGIDKKYQKTCASFLSRLSRYFIENGQVSNTCQSYSEVYENNFYVCLIDIEIALPYLIKRKYINMKKRKKHLNENRINVSLHLSNDVDDWYSNDQSVLESLLDYNAYYTSQKHFEDERDLAQSTIEMVIEFLNEIDDINNLMILAKNNEINTDWYYLEKKEGNKFYIKTNESELVIKIDNILNWNYLGITPLYSFALDK